MLTDEQLGEALGLELDGLAGDLTPRPGIADRAIRGRRSQRRRIALAGAGTAAVAVAAASTLALTSSGSVAGGAAGARGPGRSGVRLAAYHFSFPRTASAVPATAASCAMGTYVLYPTPGPGQGASDPGDQAISTAVTNAGGCVSMLLTDPYTPGAATAPATFYSPVQTSSVTIAGSTGTIGTYEFLGGDDTTIHGVHVPSGTQHTELSLEIPAADGQVQELLVATAGLSEQQLESMVASGLEPNPSSR